MAPAPPAFTLLPSLAVMFLSAPQPASCTPALLLCARMAATTASKLLFFEWFAIESTMLEAALVAALAASFMRLSSFIVRRPACSSRNVTGGSLQSRKSSSSMAYRCAALFTPMTRSAVDTSVCCSASSLQADRNAASEASTADGGAGATGAADSGAAVLVPSSRQQGRLPCRLWLRNGFCAPLVPCSTAAATSPSIKSTSTPGRPRFRSSCSVNAPLRPFPSDAVSPGSQANATTDPAFASILASPRPRLRLPPRMVGGLLRQASRTTRLRWHPREWTRSRTCDTRSAL